MIREGPWMDGVPIDVAAAATPGQMVCRAAENVTALNAREISLPTQVPQNMLPLVSQFSSNP